VGLDPPGIYTRTMPLSDETSLDPVWKTDEILGIDPDCSPTKVCRNARDFTFDGITEGDEDLASAWKRILVTEGKAAPEGGSLADLVLGPPADD